jgi:carboxypeptidase PM20D1
MARLAKNPNDTRAANVLWEHPEHVGVTRTTCVATMLRGGHAENALPQSATGRVNCRIFPGIEVSEVREILRGLVRNPAIRIEVLGESRPSPASPVRDDVMKVVGLAVEDPPGHTRHSVHGALRYGWP